MLNAARIRELHGDALALFRDLGYAIAPVTIDPAEWRRAGIALRWNGTSSFSLAARMRRFDLFHLRGDAEEPALLDFLKSYREYNVLTKSVVLHERDNALSVYDLSQHRKLRRLDVDLRDPSPHALDRLNLLTATDTTAIAKVFDIALDRESVTRRFFERFRDAVRDVSDALSSACADEPGDACDAEALLILSRLLFLSFVQEKGWLNGERRFLLDRLGERHFFKNVLTPLFFGCLNTPLRDRDAGARRLGRIPYLNGGLFEPSAFEWRHPALGIADEVMRFVVEDVFERFDFSSDERDSAGTHVDPEMLGKVFESLMAADERAASGSFYTPREIVDALTERAVAEWLGEGDAGEKLGRLDTIAVLDPACGSGAFLLSALGVIERWTRRLSEEANVPVTPNLRQQIVERSLFGVDLKPEAVRLCELRLWLAIVSTTNAEVEQIPPLPNLDRNILQGNSLLGPADFLGDARGEIYREWVYALRAQSDLVERYRHAPRDERPALSRLIRENDRRLASDLVARAIDTDETELQQLTAPQQDLFGRALVADLERCRELQARIARHRRTLDRIEDGTLDFFSFDVHFAPVMARGGFDVVVGNPPWVRNARIDARAKRMVSDRYTFFRSANGGAAFHQPDLSVAFFERALSLAGSGGIVSMLMPAKILNAAYAAPLRRAALQHDVVAIEDWSASAKRYFDADTFPLGLTLRRVAQGSSLRRRSLLVIDDDLSFQMSRDDLAAACEWALVPPDAAAILRRLRAAHRPLAITLGRRPLMGVKTGDNHAFFLGECRIRGAALITGDGLCVPLAHVARCVRGRDLKRWSAGASEWMVWPPRNGWKKPPRWLEKLAAARGVDISAFQLAYVKPEHVGIKVAWKDVSRGMTAAVLSDSVDVTVDGKARAVPLVPNQTLYSIDAASLDEAYALSAVLNSTIANALLLAVAERAKDAHFRMFGRTVAQLPLPPLDDAAVLTPLARRAHAGRDVVAEVDQAVAKLYGVSERELGKLRRFVDHRLAR